MHCLPPFLLSRCTCRQVGKAALLRHRVQRSGYNVCIAQEQRAAEVWVAHSFNLSRALFHLSRGKAIVVTSWDYYRRFLQY